MQPTHTRAAGFTIIELMITVAVASILLAIGVPAFNDIIRNSRIATQTNTLVGALNYARGESAVRGMPISICAANNDRTGCQSGATSWVNGWVIFTDRSGTAGVVDAPGDEVLQTGLGPVAFTITTTANFVRFGVGTTPSTARVLTVTPIDTNACATTGRRLVDVSLTGRITTSKGTC
ncbi:GspH/FimT family pseudopilin [Steroidobacter sp.]|uniref:GspH/FimT family pseudopilin n=1 Tax=Steroidobacter sp. TaxID=1978227 RepID=UPI001A39D493|nr:GspH/FimT family pseudopilin [Steroidobacter sp.]MBL8268257.1 GspH/FimT family pseudopilin [Steroidobacter sp.]